MTQTSLVPVRELMKAICVEPTPGKPPESLEMISSANWCANLRSSAIDFADNRFIRGAANVVHPGGDGDFGGGFGEVAEGDEIGIERGSSPGLFLELVGRGRNLRGIEAGR